MERASLTPSAKTVISKPGGSLMRSSGSFACAARTCAASRKAMRNRYGVMSRFLSIGFEGLGRETAHDLLPDEDQWNAASAQLFEFLAAGFRTLDVHFPVTDPVGGEIVPRVLAVRAPVGGIHRDAVGRGRAHCLLADHRAPIGDLDRTIVGGDANAQLLLLDVVR